MPEGNESLNQPFWSFPPERSDVVVVGGGLIGTAICLHLAMKGIQVCLIESQRLASGASGRNDGQIILETVDYYPRMIELYGHETAHGILNFKREGQNELHDFLIETGVPEELAYHRSGSLTLAYNDAEKEKITDAVEAMEKDGFHSQIVNANEIEELIGSRAFDYGKLDPLDAVVNPAELTKTFAKQAAAHGARIVEGLPVTGIGPGVVEFDGGSIGCEIALVATNAYVSNLLPQFKKWVFPTRGQVLATEPSEHRYAPMGCITNFGYDYWHWAPDGRLILGGRRFVDEHREVGTDEFINPKIQSALDDLIKEIYPNLDLKIATRWSGIMGFSGDGLPIVGPISGDPTMWSAVAFTGYGLGLSWSIGKAVAEALDGQDTARTRFLTKLHPNRFA